MADRKRWLSVLSLTAVLLAASCGGAGLPGPSGTPIATATAPASSSPEPSEMPSPSPLTGSIQEWTVYYARDLEAPVPVKLYAPLLGQTQGLLGSVARAVVLRAKCSVLVVPTTI